MHPSCAPKRTDGWRRFCASRSQALPEPAISLSTQSANAQSGGESSRLDRAALQSSERLIPRRHGAPPDEISALTTMPLVIASNLGSRHH